MSTPAKKQPIKRPRPFVPEDITPPQGGKCGAAILRKEHFDQPDPETGYKWRYAETDDGRHIVASFCLNDPVQGAKRCGTHGGRAKQVKAAAARVVQEEKVAKAINSLGIVPESELGRVDVFEEFQKALDRARRRVIALEQYVADLQDDSLYTENEKTSEEQAGFWITVLETAVDRYNALLIQAQKLGFKEREVAVQEAQVVQIQQILMMAAVGLGQLRGVTYQPAEVVQVLEGVVKEINA